jgi:hypothetical protein
VLAVNTDQNKPNIGRLIDNHVSVPNHLMKEAKEIFEKAAREQGLKVYVQHEPKGS